MRLPTAFLDEGTIRKDMSVPRVLRRPVVETSTISYTFAIARDLTSDARHDGDSAWLSDRPERTQRCLVTTSLRLIQYGEWTRWAHSVHDSH